jgi:hypothetical protein
MSGPIVENKNFKSENKPTFTKFQHKVLQGFVDLFLHFISVFFGNKFSWMPVASMC